MSASRLRVVRPELFRHPHSKWGTPLRSVTLPLAGEHLYVTDEAFRSFADGAVNFIDEIAAFLELHGDERFPIGSHPEWSSPDDMPLT